MKWVPLLVVSGGTELENLQDWSLLLLSLMVCQTNRINYKFSGGDWVTGQPRPLFETFASASLAGI